VVEHTPAKTKTVIDEIQINETVVNEVALPIDPVA
jgi:hypothetical protein